MAAPVHAAEHADRPAREREGGFNPRYAVHQDAFDRFCVIDRADQELAYLPKRDDVRRDLGTAALVANAHATMALEGHHLPLGEVRQFLTQGTRLRGGQEHVERLFRNHAGFVQAMAEEPLPETPDDVRALHARLFDGVLPDAGRFKAEPNQMKAPWLERAHPSTPPGHVAEDLEHLLAWFGHAPEHRLVRVAVFHHAFLRIHPFQVGSGHVGRALMLHMLHHVGYSGVAYVELLNGLWANRTSLDEAFVHADEDEGCLTPWVDTMSHAFERPFAQAALRLLFRRELPPDLGKRAVRIAECIYRWDMAIGGISLRAGDIALELPDIPRRTIQRELTALWKADVLDINVAGGHTTYRIAGSVDPLAVLQAKLKGQEKAQKEARKAEREARKQRRGDG